MFWRNPSTDTARNGQLWEVHVKVPGDAPRTLQKTPWGGVASYGVAGPCTPPCAQTLCLFIEMLLPNHSSEASLTALEDVAILSITPMARNKTTHTRAEGGTPAAQLSHSGCRNPNKSLGRRARTTLGLSRRSPSLQPCG